MPIPVFKPSHYISVHADTRIVFSTLDALNTELAESTWEELDNVEEGAEYKNDLDKTIKNSKGSTIVGSEKVTGGGNYLDVKAAQYKAMREKYHNKSVDFIVFGNDILEGEYFYGVVMHISLISKTGDFRKIKLDFEESRGNADDLREPFSMPFPQEG